MQAVAAVEKHDVSVDPLRYQFMHSRAQHGLATAERTELIAKEDFHNNVAGTLRVPSAASFSSFFVTAYGVCLLH
jgi:hypothetical protein